MDVEEAVLTWREEGGYTGGRLGGRDGTRGGRGGPQRGREDGSVVYCYYCKEPGHTKYQCPPLKEKPARGAHVSATISDDEQLRY